MQVFRASAASSAWGYGVGVADGVRASFLRYGSGLSKMDTWEFWLGCLGPDDS